MDSFEQVHDLFVLVPPFDANNKDFTYCNIPKGLPQLINGGPRLCERWDLGMIPAVQWSSNKKSKVKAGCLVQYNRARKNAVFQLPAC